MCEGEPSRASLVGIGEDILIQALRAALEGAVAQRHQPQQRADDAARRRQRSGEVQQVCSAA